MLKDQLILGENFMLTISIILFILFTVFSFLIFKWVFKVIVIVLFCSILFHVVTPFKKIIKPFYSNRISKNKTTKNYLDTFKKNYNTRLIYKEKRC